ncbi:MAG: phosphate ABC transporter substrate-binding protein [Desulfomonile sp.]|nr:phosphate ABC transporter substrate-binding protein [Desulfomonile sp.]
MLKKRFLLAMCACLVMASAALALEVDKDLPAYKKASGVSGNLKSVGSDTLNNLMALWSEGFKGQYPNVNVSIEGKGSSTAPPALIEGTAQFGPMSREMKQKEIEAFEKKYGYKPSVARVAVDSLAVFVHKDNPIKCLTLKQVDGIFSKTLKGGGKDIKTWGDLGLTGEWADKPLSLYGRNSASGTYGYFKEVALFHGDYKDSVKEQPGSSAVVQGVASDKYGIGYSGVGYKTPDVKIVPLGKKAGECVDATAENAYAGTYPLARFLYIYFNKNPKEVMSPLMAEFIRYIYSKEGQLVVIKDGFYPVSKALADEDLKKVGLAK